VFFPCSFLYETLEKSSLLSNFSVRLQILILEILLCMSVVKIFVFLNLEPRLNIKYGFNWAGKIKHFSKVSLIVIKNVLSVCLIYLDDTIPPTALGLRETDGSRRTASLRETYAKRPLLPNSGVRLKF